MAATTGMRTCPGCGEELRPYHIPAAFTLRRYFAAEAACGLVVLTLAPILFALGVDDIVVVATAAVPIALLLLYRTRKRWGGRKQAKRVRYYCKHCRYHFEGDTLRKLAA